MDYFFTVYVEVQLHIDRFCTLHIRDVRNSDLVELVRYQLYQTVHSHIVMSSRKGLQHELKGTVGKKGGWGRGREGSVSRKPGSSVGKLRTTVQEWDFQVSTKGNERRGVAKRVARGSVCRCVLYVLINRCLSYMYAYKGLCLGYK